MSDETDIEFQLNHVAVLATTGHFPKLPRFARDDDGNMIEYVEVSHYVSHILSESMEHLIG